MLGGCVFVVSVIVSPSLKMYYISRNIWTSYSACATLFNDRDNALVVISHLSQNDKDTDFIIEKVEV